MQKTIAELTTETRNPRSMDLDLMTPLELVTLMNQEDAAIAGAVQMCLVPIAQAVETGIKCLQNCGRIIYMGAGTSGRLGVLDASECPPTFGVSPGTVTGLIAGGEPALTKAAEGAEDSKENGERDLKDIHLTGKDFVIGIAASGRTPYVLGGLAFAKKTGCRTASISCNEDSETGRAADIAIDVPVGPEVLTGSTRLKAGTATKMVLNMISTGVMNGTGKTYQNLMVDVMQSNDKLRQRALNIVIEATGTDQETAQEALTQANGSCKTAIVSLLCACSAQEAEQRLAETGGHVRSALTLKGKNSYE